MSETLNSGVYMILCVPTGQAYVGQSVNIKTRLYKHKYYLQYGKHKNRYLQEAWDKYHQASFQFSILERISVQALLIEAENKWINRLETYKTEKGFNIQVTIDTDQDLRSSNINKVASTKRPSSKLKTILKISMENGSITETNSEELAQEGFIKNAFFYTLKYWKSTNHSYEIDSKLKHPKRSHKGYIFVYKKNYNPDYDYLAGVKAIYRKPREKKELKKIQYTRSAKRPIIATNITTGEETTYPSIRDAAKALEGRHQGITKALTGERSSYRGYTFRYVDPTWAGTHRVSKRVAELYEG